MPFNLFDDIDVWIDDGHTVGYGTIRAAEPYPTCMRCGQPLTRYADPSFGPDAVVYTCANPSHAVTGGRS